MDRQSSQESNLNNSGIIKKDARGSLDSNFGISQNRINLLKPVFDSFDGNGNGFINPKELKDAIVTMGLKLKNKEVYKLVSQFDADGDGKINFKEFIDMMSNSDLSNQNLKELQKAAKTLIENNHFSPVNKKRFDSSLSEDHDIKILSSIPKDKLDKYEVAFRALDSHSSGFINPKDLLDTLTGMGFDVIKENIYDMISELDNDGDGSLSLNEFLIGMVKKEKSIYVRNLRVVAKEIIDSKKKENKSNPRVYETKKLQRKLLDPKRFQTDNGEFKELFQLFDVLDSEGEGEISLKFFKEHAQEIHSKLGLEERKSLAYFIDASGMNMNFEQFFNFIDKNKIPVNNLSKITQEISIYII